MEFHTWLSNFVNFTKCRGLENVELIKYTCYKSKNDSGQNWCAEVDKVLTRLTSNLVESTRYLNLKVEIGPLNPVKSSSFLVNEEKLARYSHQVAFMNPNPRGEDWTPEHPSPKNLGTCGGVEWFCQLHQLHER